MREQFPAPADLDFQKLRNLDEPILPAVMVDGHSSEVLMLGFMNQQAYSQTVEQGFVTFWSRTKQGLWTKGETSGNLLKVNGIVADCDNDSLVVRVDCLGSGNVCHRGTRTCF